MLATPRRLLTGTALTPENFKSPPMDLGILPFWFWNGAMDEQEMRWQLREYREKGVSGVFIHGRFGLKVPYVSDEWFEKVKIAVRLAKEIGIEAWVYDEMNWPSGTAERNVLKKYPRLKQRYLELVALQIDGPLFTFLEATDNRYVNTGDSYPIAAFGCTEEEYQTVIRHPIDLTQNLSFERVIPWEAPAGKWRLLYFLEKEVPYYIDTMNPEATNRFLEVTHERYKETVGSEFGKTLPGFYTDEPAMHYYHVGLDNYVVPWSSQMFRIFRERRGYDLRPYLPALYLNMGERTASLRYDFWRTLTEQYSETYYKRIRDWCEANGLIFTGHVLLEEWMRLHARCEGNIFKHLRHMHLIGVDHLYPKIGSAKEPAEHVALKIGSSAAHHFGSARVLCESMGGTYWDCTLERMKWIANWEYVLGVNLFNNHGYHYSIEGERKRDWPPSQFYHHTWWKYYDRFTTYMSRLSHALTGGRHVAKVLVLYPITSVWTNYTPQARTPEGNAAEFDFNWLTDTLLRLHYDFDYVDEDVLAEASIEGGRITIRDESYTIFILPPVTHIKRATFDALKRFVRGGGHLIADALLPVGFMEAERDGVAKEVRALFGVHPVHLREAFQKEQSMRLSLLHRKAGGDVYVFKGKGLHCSAGASRALASVLVKCGPPDVTISDEDVFYLHRIKDGRDLFFLVNTTKEEKRGVEVTFEQLGRPELWDPDTGTVTPLHVYNVKKGRLSILLDFAPCGSHVVVVKAGVREPHVLESGLHIESFDGERLIGTTSAAGRAEARVSTSAGVRKIAAKPVKPLKPLTIAKSFRFQPEGDNVLTIARWKMRVCDEENDAEGTLYGVDVDDREWLNVTNGAWEMQLPEERHTQRYPVTLWYRTSFRMKFVPPNTRLLIDGFSGSSHRLYVNGREVADRGKRSGLDAEMKEIDIQPYVREGTNIVAVELVVQRRTDGILDLLKILGDFAVEKEDGQFVVARRGERIKVGDWTTQGYPFYSGTGIYRAEIDVPARYLDGRMMLEADCGDDVLEVRVNGSVGTVVPWHPYRLDVTSALRAGANTIELRVTNTLINMLEAVQKPSGLFSPPRLVHERRHTLCVTK